MVALHYDNTFICGGSLISAQHVITAAHCVQDKKGRRIHERYSYFIVGGHNLDYNEESQQQLGVNYFLSHPDWKPQADEYDADVSIAFLSRKVQYNKYIVPVCLPNPSRDSGDLVGLKGYVAGWGEK